MKLSALLLGVGVASAKWNHLLHVDCNQQMVMFADQVNMKMAVDLGFPLSKLLDELQTTFVAQFRATCPTATLEEAKSMFPLNLDNLINSLDSTKTVYSKNLGEFGCARLSVENIFDDGFPALDMPSTCNSAVWAAKGTCGFEIDIGPVALKTELKKCPGSVVPQVTVQCSGPACENFAKPCSDDSQCGSLGCTFLDTQNPLFEKKPKCFTNFNPSICFATCQTAQQACNQKCFQNGTIVPGCTSDCQATFWACMSADSCTEPGAWDRVLQRCYVAKDAAAMPVLGCSSNCLMALQEADRICTTSGNTSWKAFYEKMLDPAFNTCLTSMKGSGAQLAQVFGKDGASIIPESKQPAGYGETVFNNLFHRASKLAGFTLDPSVKFFHPRTKMLNVGMCGLNFADMTCSEKTASPTPMGSSPTPVVAPGGYDCGRQCVVANSVLGYGQVDGTCRSTIPAPGTCPNDKPKTRFKTTCPWLKPLVSPVTAPATESWPVTGEPDANVWASATCDGEAVFSSGTQTLKARMKLIPGAANEIWAVLKDMLKTRGLTLTDDQIRQYFWPMSTNFWSGMLDDSKARPNQDYDSFNVASKLYDTMTRSECFDTYMINMWQQSLSQNPPSSAAACVINPYWQQLKQSFASADWVQKCGSQLVGWTWQVCQTCGGCPAFTSAQTFVRENIPKLLGLPSTCNVATMLAGSCAMEVDLNKIFQPMGRAGSVRVRMSTCTNGLMAFYFDFKGTASELLSKPVSSVCKPDQQVSCGSGYQCSSLADLSFVNGMLGSHKSWMMPCATDADCANLSSWTDSDPQGYMYSKVCANTICNIKNTQQGYSNVLWVDYATAKKITLPVDNFFRNAALVANKMVIPANSDNGLCVADTSGGSGAEDWAKGFFQQDATTKAVTLGYMSAWTPTKPIPGGNGGGSGTPGDATNAAHHGVPTLVSLLVCSIISCWMIQ